MTNQDVTQEELAALYALDVLEPQEREAVEYYLAEEEEFAQTVAEFEAAVTTLAYHAPPVTMAADLKERLFQRISEISPSEPPPPQTTVIKAAAMKWEPHLVPGVKLATLYIDEARRTITCLMKVEPGVEYPLHSHADVEEIFMVEGDLAIAGETLSQGDYIRSEANSSHSPITYGGCTILVRASLDNEFLTSVPTSG